MVLIRPQLRTRKGLRVWGLQDAAIGSSAAGFSTVKSDRLGFGSFGNPALIAGRASQFFGQI